MQRVTTVQEFINEPKRFRYTITISVLYNKNIELSKNSVVRTANHFFTVTVALAVHIVKITSFLNYLKKINTAKKKLDILKNVEEKKKLASFFCSYVVSVGLFPIKDKQTPPPSVLITHFL